MLAFNRADDFAAEIEEMRARLTIQEAVLTTLELAKQRALEAKEQQDLLVTTKAYEEFSLADLMNNNIPDWLDRREKEAHLSDKVFQQVFGMNKDEFAKLSEWKRKKMKTKAGLY